MNITPVSNQAADNVPLEEIAGDKALTQQQKVSEVARQFESLLLKQILQETQKTVIPSKYADNSTAAGIYHDMVSNQLADSISKSGALGLAHSLERQLTHQLQPASTAGSDRSAVTNPLPGTETDTVRPTLSQNAGSFRTSGSEVSQTLRPLGNPLHPLPATAISTKPF
ncbi:MAG: rod-binding protein [Limisphaerales bacterium]